MLNVPDAVKALFKTDGIAKNFRVHFPNSEYRDLTNSDIVAGSVKFTESVCSKEVLQFGLAEASRIEFECVGVPNIYGATIECFCEVDTSSLSAEYQTVKADVSYPVYAVPYGSFMVQSCPRNAGAMTHRRVEGYGSEVANVLQPSAFLTGIESIGSDTDNVLINTFLLLASESNDITGLTLTESTKTFSAQSVTAPTIAVRWKDGNITCTVKITDLDLQRCAVNVPKDSLFRFTSEIDRTGIDQLYAFMKENGADEGSINTVRGLIEPSVWYGYSSGWLTRFCAVPFENGEDSGYKYVYNGNSLNNRICYADSYTLTVTVDGVDTVFTDSGYTTNVVLKEYASSDSLYIRMKSTGKWVDKYTFVDSIDIEPLFVGEAELMARFLQTSRNGGLKSVTLSKSSPITISKSEHSDFWFDEYSISPIGSIKYTYYDIDLKQEQTQIYSFGEGLSEYDMTDNYLLKHLAVSASDLTDDQTVEEYVQSLFDTYFIPNITDISFIPVDLDMIGLPYIEAGDYIEVVAEDNTVVGTYVLSRSLSGEQYLTDAVESKGGEIIGPSVRSA